VSIDEPRSFTCAVPPGDPSLVQRERTLATGFQRVKKIVLPAAAAQRQVPVDGEMGRVSLPGPVVRHSRSPHA
jgi:hypothetical protein